MILAVCIGLAFLFGTLAGVGLILWALTDPNAVKLPW